MAISLASDVASKPQRTQRGYTATKKLEGHLRREGSPRATRKRFASWS